MPTQSRALPFILVGAFAVLLLGGIALSLSSAPPLAQQQLQNAAHATMAASGFTLKDTNSVLSTEPGANAVANGAPSRSVVFFVVYEAPASIQETEVDANGGNASIIAIGDRGFRKTGSQWTEFASSKGLGARAVATIMSPVQGAAGATKVTRRGAVYDFVPTDFRRLLTEVLGVSTTQLSSPRVTAEVRGGALTRETITAVDAHDQLVVDLVFSSIGSAPPVRVPAL
jgi:hypothetical protein